MQYYFQRDCYHHIFFIHSRICCHVFLMYCIWFVPGFTVRGPAVPLSVQLGASVTLPCSVDTPLPLNELEVEWMRAESGTLVHLFQEGQSRPESQNPSYSSRAEFFTEEIPKGNFSLLLINVTTEDEGMYTCIVHTDQRSNETNVELAVEWLVVTGTNEAVFAYAGEDVVLNCSVDTHVPLHELQVEWMKMDILVLLFEEGQNIPESQHERFWGRAEFFTEEIPKGNFSLKLRGVRTGDRGEFTCKIHTNTESVSATAWLKLGFSSSHISVLVLSTVAIIAAVAMGVPALLGMLRGDIRNGSLKLYYLQVSIPCILICVTFIIWGVSEGFVEEAYICSAVNLLRILMLFKVAPYLDQLPKIFKRICKVCPSIEFVIIVIGINSAVFAKFPEVNFFALFVCLPLLITFCCIWFSGFIAFGALLIASALEMWFLGVTFNNISYEYLTESLIGVVGAIIFSRMRKCCIFRGNQLLIFSELCNIFVGGCFLLAVISSLRYMDVIFENDKEHDGWMCLSAFFHILAVTMAFKHAKDVP
ncbi:hypothetical protein JZ751_028970, partial [Albula glossodonta]